MVNFLPISIKESRGKSGIYAIVHKDSGKFYIGSSVNIYRRLMEHRSALRHERHYNDRLQKAWAKHGAKGFFFSIVEEVEPDKIYPVEQGYLDRLRPWHRDVGYNLASRVDRPSAGDGAYNYTLDEPTVRRMRWERVMLGDSYAEIARRYGVGKNAARFAICGRSWSHVPGAIVPDSLDETGRPTHNALFTDDDVREMRVAYSLGESFSEIAERVGSSYGNVYNAVTGTTYGHVPGAVETRPAPEPADPYEGREMCEVTGKPVPGSASLTAMDVVEMRRDRKTHRTPYYKIAERYGVWPRTAMQAIRGERWQHVDHIEAPFDDSGEGIRHGEHNASSKLTEEDVITMRRMRKAGNAGAKTLAKMFGIGLNTARRATDGSSWSHLNEVEAPFVWCGN